jgi:transcriptional regulator with XRE-family HTH domain
MLRQKLKEFRKSKQLSQAKMAELINSTDKYISALETRKDVSLSIEKFAEISKAIGISEFEIILAIRDSLNYTCDFRCV